MSNPAICSIVSDCCMTIYAVIAVIGISSVNNGAMTDIFPMRNALKLTSADTQLNKPIPMSIGKLF